MTWGEVLFKGLPHQVCSRPISESIKLRAWRHCRWGWGGVGGSYLVKKSTFRPYGRSGNPLRLSCSLVMHRWGRREGVAVVAADSQRAALVSGEGPALLAAVAYVV